MKLDYAKIMNFTWIQQNVLAASKGPVSDDDLAFLKAQGIRALVRLELESKSTMTTRRVEAAKLRDCYEPVPDFTPPHQDQVDRVLKFIKGNLEAGRPVVVSCGAGYGRSGTLIACYLALKGQPTKQAIEYLIQVRPSAREILSVPGQREAVLEFERRLASGTVKI